MSIKNKEAIGLLQMAMEETSSAEKTFTVELTESELTTIVAALWHKERNQVRLAQIARREENTKLEAIRRESAAAALRLADKLCVIGAKP